MAATIEGKVQHVDHLMTELIRADRTLDPEAARTNIESDARRSLERYQVAGVDIVPAAILDKVAAEYAERYDGKTAENVLELEASIRATDAALELQIGKSRLAPPVQNDLRELVWYRRLEGRSLADVVRAYDATDDRDPLIGLVESAPGELAQTFRLVPSENDVAAMMLLQKAIASRQDQRQDADATKRLAALREHRRTAFRFAHAVVEARAGRLEVARKRRTSVGG
jgi:hypothetical protein